MTPFEDPGARLETTSHRPSGAAGAAGTWECPECGARNRASAEWCGQCFSISPHSASPDASRNDEDLNAGAEPAPAGAAPASLEEAMLRVAKNRSRSREEVARVEAGPGVDEARPAPRRGAFTVASDGITWTCKQCDEVNELSGTSCVVCGTPFSEVLREPTPARPARDPGMAALMSLVFPGAGHAYLGLWGQAVARGVVSAWVGLVVFFAALQGGPGALPTLAAFGCAAFCLWGVAAHDAYRAARGEEDAALLKSNYFLGLVLGLLGLQIGLLFVSALAAR